jgi:hypothetical protein
LEGRRKPGFGLPGQNTCLLAKYDINKVRSLPMKPLHLPRITCTLQRDLTGFGGMAPDQILGRRLL